MVRYGETLKHVRGLVLSKPANAMFRSRELVPIIERKVGYKVSSRKVGQCLAKMKEAGFVRLIRDPEGRNTHAWVKTGGTM